MATLYTEEQLKNLVLQCPDENTNYPSPDIMVDEHGNRMYAYVTLIMLGDRYIPGAIVLAHTIRRLDSQADLVVLVTPDVSEDGKKIMSQFFDRVILVKPIHVPNWRTKKQKHRLYLDYVFTKFHLFNLNYKKVLMIDADALILKYPDHLFSLDAPAGSLIEDKDQFISYDESGNYILPPDGKIKWYQMLCKCCGHGKVIPKQMTDKVARDYRNSGIGASIVLLAPKRGELESIVKDVTMNGKMKYLVENKFIWPEQQYLTLRYSGTWTGVNPRFYGLQGYPHWSVLYSLQYAGDKPWFLDSKADISIRTQYPDFILWHKYYAEILEMFPHFKTDKVLDEANQMHKFFAVKLHQQRRLLSRYTMNRTPEQIGDLIKKTVGVKNVTDSQLDTYFLDPKISYSPHKLKPMFLNIGEYDYFKPLERLAGNFSEPNYYSKLLGEVRGLQQPQIVQVVGERLDTILGGSSISRVDMDNIVLQYIRCRPLSFVITIWPIAYNQTDKIVGELKENGNVYYVKSIHLSYNGLRNLMFWMYDEFSFHEREAFISKKMDYVNANKYEDNKVSFILFDNVKSMKISGQASEFKRYIRDFTVGLLRGDREIRGNDVIHVNDYFYQAVNYSEMLLNSNSINLLNNQAIALGSMADVDRIGHFKFQTFKKFLYTNLSPLEISKIITIGGTVLYAYGVRPQTDIDSIMIQPNNPELEQLMYDNFQNGNTKFEFADMGIEGSHWHESWTIKNKQILDYFNISSVADLVCNPRYHMYYQGIKLYLLDHEIVRKLYRFRSQDFADFVVMLLFRRDLISKYITVDDRTSKLAVRDPKFPMKKFDKTFIGCVYDIINRKYPFDIKSKITYKMVSGLLLSSDAIPQHRCY
jgi:lipopolysaccharide biosynthesis glycosyltransferase